MFTLDEQRGMINDDDNDDDDNHENDDDYDYNAWNLSIINYQSINQSESMLL